MDINLEYVSRAKQGDAQSFAMLYDQVAKDLYRVALYTLGNPQDAEDVVSETFLEAYKGLRNLRDDSKFKAWISSSDRLYSRKKRFLCRILYGARHCCISWMEWSRMPPTRNRCRRKQNPPAD